MRRKAVDARSLAIAATLLFGIASTGAGQVRVGAKGGFNRSNVSLKIADEKVDTESRGGYNVGGLIYFGFSASAGLQIEGLYTTKGFKRAEGLENDTWEFAYWEVPVLLMFTSPTAMTQPRLLFGPTISFESSCTRKTGGFGENENEIELPCVPGTTKSTDIGFMAGLGIKVTSLTIDLAYEWGFKDILESEVVSLKNRNMTFSIGIAIPN